MEETPYKRVYKKESGPTACPQAPIPAAQSASLLGLMVVAWGPRLCLSRVSMTLPVRGTQGLQALLPGIWSTMSLWLPHGEDPQGQPGQKGGARGVEGDTWECPGVQEGEQACRVASQCQVMPHEAPHREPLGL